jgi:hypothetical protein
MKQIHGMPIKWNGDDGDAMLWAGLMTSVGYKEPIEGIKMCQTSDGRLWRSPNRVNNQPKNSFSRDMALGFILYFQATQDHDMADKWVSYILREGSLFPAAQSSDNRHMITPALWWLMSYAGMRVPAKYRYTRFMFNSYNKLELLFTPRGYQRHLKAVSALIMAKHMGKRDTFYGKFLIKQDPENPFFQWLAGDFCTRNYVDLNEKIKVEWVSSLGNGSQWAWERSDDEEAHKDAMGQEFDFINSLHNIF